MSRIDEIKGRLAAATPGPWDSDHQSGVFGDDGFQVASVEGCAIAKSYFNSGMERHWAVTPGAFIDRTDGEYGGNLELIANATTDIAWLLERNATLEADLEKARACASCGLDCKCLDCTACGQHACDKDALGECVAARTLRKALKRRRTQRLDRIATLEEMVRRQHDVLERWAECAATEDFIPSGDFKSVLADAAALLEV